MRNRVVIYIFVLLTISFDLTVLLDIPLLDRIIPSIYLLFVPGLVLLYSLNIKRIIDFKETFIFTLTGSMFVLIIVGLVTNSISFFLNIKEPLSIQHLLLSLNLFILGMLLNIFKKAKLLAVGRDNLRMKINLKVLNSILLSTLLPILTLLGVKILDVFNTNYVILTTFLLILMDSILIIIMSKKLPENIKDVVYFTVVLSIGISLLWAYGMTSKYIIGMDIHEEYYIFRLTYNNKYWDIHNARTVVNACLSVSLLPTIYQQFIRFQNPQFVFKFLYQIIGSVLPLTVYTVLSKHVDKKYALIGAFFYMFQLPFINTLQSSMKQEIAMVFAYALILVRISERLSVQYRKLFSILFILGLVVSHYTIAYALLFVMLIGEGLMEIIKKYDSVNKYNTNLTMVVLMYALLVLWYGEITKTSYHIENFFRVTFRNLWNFYLEEVRRESVQVALGMSRVTSISRTIRIYLYRIIIGLIGIGTIGLLANFNAKKIHIKSEIKSMIYGALMVFGANVIVPYASIGYSPTRAFQFLLIFFVFALIVGIEMIYRAVKLHAKSKDYRYAKSMFIIFLLSMQFLSSSYMLDQIFGYHTSIIFNRDGQMYETLYIHDSEIIASKWLNNYKDETFNYYTDSFGFARLLMGLPARDYSEMKKLYAKTYRITYADDAPKLKQKLKTKNGYIYLRYTNVYNKKIYPKVKPSDYQSGGTKPLSEFAPILLLSQKIYSSNSEVYLYERP